MRKTRNNIHNKLTTVTTKKYLVVLVVRMLFMLFDITDKTSGGRWLSATATRL